MRTGRRPVAALVALNGAVLETILAYTLTRR